MAGYTPQLRGLGTAEGDFHAEVTTWHAQTRRHVRELAATHSSHKRVAAFTDAFTADREAVWTTWKRTLPIHLRPIVLSVKDLHHGPGLAESGSAEYRTFLSLVKAVCGRTRRRLDDLVAAMPGDAAVVDCRVALEKRLDAIEAALTRHQETLR